MIRKHIKRSLEWLHVFLILSVIVPLIYMGDSRRDPQQLYQVYFTGYILLLPIVGIMSASRRCKKIWKYLLIVVCIYFAVSVGAGKLGAWYLDEIADLIYVGCMKICTLVIAFLAFAMRIYMARRKEAREIRDASWVEAEIRLDKPNKLVSMWFIAVYTYALNMACPQVCNIALFSTLAYLLLAVAYEFIDKTEDYLKINEGGCRVRNIPYKRIYGIGKFFLLIQLCLLLFTIIPAVLTINGREYRDIRTNSFKKKEIVEQTTFFQPYEDIPAFEMPEPELEEDPRNELLIKILDTVLYSISTVTMLIILIVGINLLRRELAKFSQSVQEEDDIVESLETPDGEEKIFTKKVIWKRTEEDKVRRTYRKFIRKHRKDRPAVFETPTEIETAAGVADTPEGKELHKQYELARYGFGE